MGKHDHGIVQSKHRHIGFTCASYVQRIRNGRDKHTVRILLRKEVDVCRILADMSRCLRSINVALHHLWIVPGVSTNVCQHLGATNESNMTIPACLQHKIAKIDVFSGNNDDDANCAL